MGSYRHTYRQAKLFKGRFDKCCVLCENLLQVPPSAHVSQNYRNNQKLLGHGVWNPV